MSNRLTDSFGRAHNYLRVSLTDRCNLRCAYCMPEHGIAWTARHDILTNVEIIRLAGIFASMGVTKLRLTGGEPLLRRDLLPLVNQLAQVPGIRTLAMTTNALLLAPIAAALRDNGLNALTVSLDTLRSDRFAALTRRDRFADAMQGITAAMNAGFTPLKLNCVVMRGVNDDELLDFVAWARDCPIGLRFIEYMPFPDNQWQAAGVMPYREMRDIIGNEYGLLPLAAEPSAVGKDYALQGYPATVSFVSSMTDSFCGTCTRLRLTADGNIKSCLFHPAEKNLRDLMRGGANDVELSEAILAALYLKPAAHPPMEQLAAMDNRSMIAIGG